MIRTFKIIFTVTSFLSLYETRGVSWTKGEGYDLTTAPSLEVRMSRIFGGRYVYNITHYPYVAFMQSRYTICSAVILNRKYALTSGHCVQYRDCSNNHKYRNYSTCTNDKSRCVGSGNETMDDKHCKISFSKADEFMLYAGSTIPYYALAKVYVTNAYIHPGYKQYDGRLRCFGRFNFAVLKLEKSLTFSKEISRVKLPKVKDRLPVNRACKVLGWGKTFGADGVYAFTSRLKVANVFHIKWSKCSANGCHDTGICFLNPKRPQGICPGDDGGPLICGDRLFGTASAIANCEGPSVFTNVKKVLEWIKMVMLETK